MTKEINSEIVKEYGMDAGATVVGIANSKDFSLAPKGFKPTDVLEECQSVIVFGSTFPEETLENPIEYTKIRNEMIEKMTALAKEVAKRIKADGYETKAINATGGKFVNGKEVSPYL